MSAQLELFADPGDAPARDAIRTELATTLFVEAGAGTGKTKALVDRVDRRADGSLVVIDYKTGSERYYRGLTHDDPVEGGRHLQLPVYAYAARAAYGSADTDCEAYFWFVGRGNNVRIGYDVDGPVAEVFDRTVRTIVDGVEGGVFPAVPAEPAPTPFIECPFCDPDGLGTTDRWREWGRKQSAPELDGLHSLAEVGASAGAGAAGEELGG